MTYAVNYCAVKYLKFWFYPPALRMVADTPFFVAVTWYGAMLAFYFLVLNILVPLYFCWF